MPAKESISRRGIALITLISLASALGYFGIFALLAAAVLDLLFGNYYPHYSHNALFIKLSGWLSLARYQSFFFGILTTPASLLIALPGLLFPVGKKAKIIAWLVALGGGLAWLISTSIMFGHGW